MMMVVWLVFFGSPLPVPPPIEVFRIPVGISNANECQ